MKPLVGCCDVAVAVAVVAAEAKVRQVAPGIPPWPGQMTSLFAFLLDGREGQRQSAESVDTDETQTTAMLEEKK